MYSPVYSVILLYRSDPWITLFKDLSWDFLAKIKMCSKKDILIEVFN